MELSHALRGPPQRGRHRCQLQEKSISVWFPFPTRNVSASWKACESPLWLLDTIHAVRGKLPSSWHLNKFGSNSSPWLLKTKTKTTVINYSVQGPGGNLKNSFQGQGFSGNRSLLIIGRASLSLAELTATFADCTVYIFSVLEQQTGTHSADSQHTEGLTFYISWQKLTQIRSMLFNLKGKEINSGSCG